MLLRSLTLASCLAGLTVASTSSTTVCNTKLGTKSQSSVPTTNTVVTSTLKPATTHDVSTTTVTNTPPAKTKTTTVTVTDTTTSTVSTITGTYTYTSTIFSTVISTSTIATNITVTGTSTSNVVVNSNFPTPNGFAPIESTLPDSDYVYEPVGTIAPFKRSVPNSRRGLRQRIEPQVHRFANMASRYPQAVTCVTKSFVQSTVTVQDSKTVTTQAPRPTETSTSTITKYSTTTVPSATVTSTVYTATVTTSTSTTTTTNTVTSTSIVQVPTATSSLFDACAANNIVNEISGSPIIDFSFTQEENIFFSQYTDTPYDCCAALFTAFPSTINHYAWLGDGSCYGFTTTTTCDANSPYAAYYGSYSDPQYMSYYQTVIGNGACGKFTQSSLEDPAWYDH